MSVPKFLETIKVKDGVFYNLPLHIERMQRTALAHHNAMPEIDLSAKMIPTSLSNELLKCRVIYSSQVLSVEFEPYKFRPINSLVLVECDEVEYGYKFLDRHKLDELKRLGGGADEIIIVKNGEITDTSYSNLVFEDTDGRLFTPNSCLLDGIKRQSLLQSGFIAERNITPQDIYLFRKVFLINAMIDIEDNVSCPVWSIISK